MESESREKVQVFNEKQEMLGKNLDFVVMSLDLAINSISLKKKVTEFLI